MRRADAPYGALFFAYFCYIGAFSAYFGLYLESTGKTAFEISTILAATQITRLFGPNVWGALADRKASTQALMRFAACAATVAFVGLWTAVRLEGAIQWLFFTLLVMQFFSSALMPLHEALVLRHLGVHRERYGPIRIWGSIGFMLAVLGLGYLFDLIALQWLGAILTALLIGVIVSVWALPTPLAPPAAAAKGTFRGELSNTKVRALFVAAFLMILAHGALYTFYSIYLKNHGYAKSTIGWMWSIGVMAEIVMFAFLPRLLKRFSLQVLFAATYWLCAVRFLTIAWGADSVVLLALAQLLHAATFAVHHGVAVAYMQRLFSASTLPRALGVYVSVSYGLGGLTGSLLSGWLWDTAGPSWVFTLSAGAAVLGAMVVHLLLREETATPPDDAAKNVSTVAHDEALMP